MRRARPWSVRNILISAPPYEKRHPVQRTPSESGERAMAGGERRIPRRQGRTFEDCVLPSPLRSFGILRPIAHPALRSPKESFGLDDGSNEECALHRRPIILRPFAGSTLRAGLWKALREMFSETLVPRRRSCKFRQHHTQNLNTPTSQT